MRKRSDIPEAPQSLQRFASPALVRFTPSPAGR